jgi:hypothetical protein
MRRLWIACDDGRDFVYVAGDERSNGGKEAHIYIFSGCNSSSQCTLYHGSQPVASEYVADCVTHEGYDLLSLLQSLLGFA